MATGPSIYSTVRGAIFDTTNDLLVEIRWDPNTLSSLRAKNLHPKEPLHPDIDDFDFTPAKPLAIPIPVR